MDDHFNELTPAEAERLAYLMEECGEVIRAAGKVLRHGWKSTNPLDPLSSTNRTALVHELGDVLKAIRVMHEAGDISLPMAQNLSEHPLDMRWFHHQAKPED